MAERRPFATRTKLALGLFAVIVCVAFGTQLILQLAVRNHAQRAADAELEREADLLRMALLSDVPDTGEPPTELDRRRFVQATKRIDARVTLLAADGRLLMDSHVLPAALAEVDAERDAPEIEGALADGVGHSVRHDPLVDAELRHVAIALEPGRSDGIAVLRVSVWEAHVDASAAPLRQTLYWIAAATVLGALLLSVLLATWVSRPARRMGRVARRVAKGKAGANALGALATTAELHDLAIAMRDLANQLSEKRKRVDVDSLHLSGLLDALEMPVLFVTPAGNIVRTNAAARERLALLMTMRDLDEAGLSDLTESLADALREDAPLCRELLLSSDEEDDVDERSKTEGPRMRFRSTVHPLVGASGPRGAVIVLEPIGDLPHRIAA